MEKNYQVGSWDLSEVLPQDIEAKLADIEVLASEFENLRENISSEMSKEDFLNTVKLKEQIVIKMHMLGAGAQLKFSEDTSNPQSSQLMGNIQRFGAELSNRMLFFSLWMKSLDDKNFERLSSNTGDYESYFNNVRRGKEFTLNEEVEQMVNLKDSTGGSVLMTVYNKITSSFRYPMVIHEEERELNESELRALYHSPNAKVRAEVYQKHNERYAKESSVLSEIYIALIRDWHNECVKIRGYKSPISVRNFSNELPDEAVDALLETCKENAGLFQRYFKMKAELCGIKGNISRTDIYAPIKETSNQTYSYDEAVKLVMEGFNTFSPEMAEMALSVLEANHVHSELGKNKAGGAYCMGMPPGTLPFVLLNHTEKARDVSTMAHELGHAVHDILATQEHGIFTYHPSIAMAETASVFSEMVLNSMLLEKATDSVLKKELLNAELGDIYATVMRQAYFVIFEKAAHDLINSPQGASVEQLSDLYYSQLQEQFGDSMEIPEDFRNEWITIPHIFRSPFYCYGYSFGQLLTLSLYEMYQKEGEAFMPKYLKILSAGGSRLPEDVLSEVGIDINSRDFWQNGFNLIKSKLDELETLLKNK